MVREVSTIQVEPRKPDDDGHVVKNENETSPSFHQVQSVAVSTRDLQQYQQQEREYSTAPRTFRRSLKQRLSKTERMKVYHLFSKDFYDEGVKTETETQTPPSQNHQNQTTTSGSNGQGLLPPPDWSLDYHNSNQQAMVDVDTWRRTERQMRMSDAPIIRQPTRPVAMDKKGQRRKESSTSTAVTSGASSPLSQMLKSGRRVSGKKAASSKVMKISKSKVAAFNTRRTADRDTGYRLFASESTPKPDKSANRDPKRWKF
jgi:hypothetical protein